MKQRSPAYHLVRPAARADGAPALDEAQQAVVDHAGGPLLVLAGPGTGKTTTIVETVVDRVTRRGIDPDRVLVLTFSRKAAGELRERRPRTAAGGGQNGCARRWPPAASPPNCVTSCCVPPSGA